MSPDLGADMKGFVALGVWLELEESTRNAPQRQRHRRIALDTFALDKQPVLILIPQAGLHF